MGAAEETLNVRPPPRLRVLPGGARIVEWDGIGGVVNGVCHGSVIDTNPARPVLRHHAQRAVYRADVLGNRYIGT
jgi:hypothetical protein